MLDLVTIIVTIGAAARTTRLVTTDVITDPLRRAALFRIAQPRHIRQRIPTGADAPPPPPVRAAAVDFLTCHWCVGFWVTAAAVAAAYLAGHTPAYQVGATVLAASYIVGWLADNERE